MLQPGERGYLDGTEEVEIRSANEDGSRVTVREIVTGIWWYGIRTERFHREEKISGIN